MRKLMVISIGTVLAIALFAGSSPIVRADSFNQSDHVDMDLRVDKLTEAELIDLNHRIAARLRFLNQMRAHSQMLDFKIGDRVTFQPEGYPRLVGMLIRYNKKTVTVITDNGQRWNVSPELLRKAEFRESTESENGKVVWMS